MDQLSQPFYLLQLLRRCTQRDALPVVPAARLQPDGLRQSKPTRRAIFFAEVEQVVPWEGL